ncbi:MAG: hypothetical protein CL565_05150 [Alphaproteobacteria bacterium]|nr:hypothetical protein [Alphaproteobacteria bacterium]
MAKQKKPAVKKKAEKLTVSLPSNISTYFEDAGIGYGAVIDTVFNMAGLAHVKPDVNCSYHYRDIGYQCSSELSVTFKKSGETVQICHRPGRYEENADSLKAALKGFETPDAG